MEIRIVHGRLEIYFKDDVLNIQDLANCSWFVIEIIGARLQYRSAHKTYDEAFQAASRADNCFVLEVPGGLA